MKRRSSSRTSLFLMELILVIFFFAVCSAVSLQVFAAARVMSERSAALSSAVLQAQSAAEVYQAAGGNLDHATDLLDGEQVQNGLIVYYDKTWLPTNKSAARYQLTLTALQAYTADIAVCDNLDGGVLYTLQVKTTGGG